MSFQKLASTIPGHYHFQMTLQWFFCYQPRNKNYFIAKYCVTLNYMRKKKDQNESVGKSQVNASHQWKTQFRTPPPDNYCTVPNVKNIYQS